MTAYFPSSRLQCLNVACKNETKNTKHSIRQRGNLPLVFVLNELLNWFDPGDYGRSLYVRTAIRDLLRRVQHNLCHIFLANRVLLRTHTIRIIFLCAGQDKKVDLGGVAMWLCKQWLWVSYYVSVSVGEVMQTSR